jgi:hypothetical protein
MGKARRRPTMGMLEVPPISPRQHQVDGAAETTAADEVLLKAARARQGRQDIWNSVRLGVGRQNASQRGA